MNFRLISAAGAECVNEPIEIRSTPVSAILRIFLRETLPEASIVMEGSFFAYYIYSLFDLVRRHIVEHYDVGSCRDRLSGLF